MNLALLFFLSTLLCLIVTLIAVTFPTTYPLSHKATGLRKIFSVSFIIQIAILIVSVYLFKFSNIRLPILDIKFSMVLIPTIAMIIFSIAPYYLSARFLAKTNIDDQKSIDTLLDHVFKCSSGDSEGREGALEEFYTFLTSKKEFICHYGLTIYLDEFIDQIERVPSKKADEKITWYLLNRLAQVKDNINHFSPIPFPNIILILSFVFSTVLTALLPILTIVS